MKKRFKLAALAATITLALTGCLANIGNTGPVWDGEEHTEPGPEEDTCLSHDDGEVDVTVDNTVVDGLCLDGGSLVINADNVTVQNSTLKAAAPEFGFAVYVLPGSGNVTVQYNIIDCQGGLNDPNAAAIGIGGGSDTSGLFNNNEVKNCSDGINSQSNWTYSYNLIHEPYNCDIVNVCDIHADGVQGQTEDDGSFLHDVLFEWNVINYPDASSSFQFHNSPTPSEGWADVVVRYNEFQGGAAVLRLPRYDNGGLEVYGNRVGRLTANEFLVCTTPLGGAGSTDVIDVWGRETGNTADSLPGDSILDDDNVNIETDAILEREDCE